MCAANDAHLCMNTVGCLLAYDRDRGIYIDRSDQGCKPCFIKAVATGYDPLVSEAPALACTMSSSGQQRITFGERMGHPLCHGFGSSGVVKDDADRTTLAGAYPAHTMAQIDTIHAARALHRPMVDREDHTVSLTERYDLSARLHARPLLRKHEFAAREVLPRYREQEGGL